MGSPVPRWSPPAASGGPGATREVGLTGCLPRQVLLLPGCSVHREVVPRVRIQQNTHRPQDAHRPHARRPDESPGPRGVRQGRLRFLPSPGRLQHGPGMTRRLGAARTVDPAGVPRGQ